MDYYYYIHDNTFINDKQGLKTGVRIEKISAIYKINFADGDGPYISLKELKKKSKIYRNIVLRNSKRAQQICMEKNISIVKDFIFTKEDFSVDKDFIEVLEHCTKGRIKNGKVYGVHYYDSERVKILEIVRENKSNGIWEAIIEVYNSKTNKWIEKETPSTFFPRNWNAHELFHECHHAVINKTEKLNSENVFISQTKSGIDVEIIVKDGKLKSIYPILK